MRYFFIILFFLTGGLALQAQTPYVYTIKADSVKITNCDSAELIIENHTQGVPGFLFNNGNGRTIFKRGLTSLGNGSFVIGTDTLNAWIQGGNSFGTTGVLGTLDNNHLDLYTSDTLRARLTSRGNLLIGTTTDNGLNLQVAGNAYFNGNVGFGQTLPAAPIDIYQFPTGSSAIGAINITDSLNTTGSPNVFNMNVRKYAAGASANIVNIAQDGISRLVLPLGAGQTHFTTNGIQIQTTFGGSGGISLNGSAPVSNAMYVTNGFLLNQPNGVSGAGASLYTFNPGALIQYTSGNSIGINVPGTFNPTSGTATYAHLALTPTINQTGGASGTTWGLLISPALTSAPNWRALEVVTGNSYFGTTSGHVLIGSTTDNSDLLQVNGRATISSIRGISSIVAPSVGTITFNADPVSSGAFMFSGNHQLQETASYGFLYINPTMLGNTVSAGVDQAMLQISPVINLAGNNDNANIRGIYYNPTLTSMGSGSPRHIAWENVTGNMIFGSTSGNVVVGSTTDNGQRLQVNGSSYFSGSVQLAGLTQDSTQTRVLVSDASGNLYYRSASSLAIDEPLRSSLAVNGTIRAKQLQLHPEGWADYVFDRSYRLPALATIEAYIRENHHLPGIISAEEVRRNGIDVGETQTALLKKVEELTLYTIDQDKRIQTLEKEVEELKKLVTEQAAKK